MSKAEMQALAQKIADTLGETNSLPRRQIAAIIKHCGVEVAEGLLRETLEIEAQGGMMLHDQSRRRTMGGVFFHLARKKVPHNLRRTIFYSSPDPNKKGGQKQSKPAHRQQPGRVKPVFNWDERVDNLKPLLAEQGEVDEVKVSLVGRPGKIDSSHQDLVITTMNSTVSSTGFPKGLPEPPDAPTLYTIYMSYKQWKNVEQSLTNPEDRLIVEGSCAYDEAIGGIVVYAMRVTSKLLDGKNAKDKKPKKPTAANPESENIPLTQSSSLRRESDKDVPPEAFATATLPSVPTEVSHKLTELYASASLFRQKIAAIQAKPAGQQFGLEMTQKLLKNVEDEIAAIEKKFQ